MLPRKLLLLFVFLLIAGAATAGTIDPELTAALAAKADGELVPVLILMEDHADLQALDRELAGADWRQRRERVTEVLRAYAAASQSDALATLAAADRAGRVERVRSLWLVNGIACRTDRRTVEELAALKSTGTLLYDRPYDMLSAVTAPRSAPSAGADASAQVPADAAPATARADTAWGVKWINANRVWLDTGYTGSGVVVGHFDTGAWLTHPDLVNRLWTNPGETAGNGIDDDGNGYVDDIHGWDFANGDADPNDDVLGAASNHGTHTAGTVLGDGTNGTITGVAPGASLMVCKSYLSDGSGAPFSAIYEGQQYGIVMGARIFTMSLGVGGVLPASLMRTEREVGDVLRTAGVVLFNAAGNDRFNYTPPDCIGVTARVPAPWNAIVGTPYTSRSGVMAVGGTAYKSNAGYTYSSRGPVTWEEVAPWNDWLYAAGGLIKPDVSAPATNVNSLQKPSGYTGDAWSGTSMACPHAAGTAALLLEKNPSLSPAGIDSLMEETALDVGTAGKDNVFGSGVLNALAAINAVPAAVRPHLTWSDVDLDGGGDGILDPGETVDIVFTLVNNSPVVDATGVTAELAIAANPYVSVVDGAASFPNVAQNGGTASNAANVFEVASTGGAPQGYVFTLYLTVHAQNGYQQTFDVDLFVGLPDYLTHEIGSVRGTVTDQGIIGYLSSDQGAGQGFGPIDGASQLFVGSFWGGNSAIYICARDYPESPLEWQVLTSPNGRVHDLSTGAASETFLSMYDDSGAAHDEGFVVTQRSYAWSAAPNDDFIVLSYTIRNGGTNTISNYYAGVFCDWDVDDYSTNEGGTDATRDLTYMFSSEGSYVGIALLTPLPAANLTLINNPTYVYPNGFIDDGFKMRHMSGLLSTPMSTAPDDWSALTSAGPFTLAPGDSIRVAFALLYGESLADLQANTDAAKAAYLTTAVDEGSAPQPLQLLAQNFPNPFNPSTRIDFGLKRPGHVRLTIYDLSGRQVRLLVDGIREAGRHHETWDGLDDAGTPMSSGLYVYRLTSGEGTVARKMMLVR
jgi:serine protease